MFAFPANKLDARRTEVLVPREALSWGWGLPTAWQGWVVLATFFGLVLAGAVVLHPTQGPGAFVTYSALLYAVK